jgi:hypothetical protein
MTYTARCPHGELWAVCRACPEWTGWPDPLRAEGTDDDPPEPFNRRLGMKVCAALLLLAFVLWKLRLVRP